MNYKNQPSFTFHAKIIIYCLPNYHPGHHLEGDNKIAQNEKKKTNTMQEFITQKYSNFFLVFRWVISSSMKLLFLKGGNEIAQLSLG